MKRSLRISVVLPQLRVKKIGRIPFEFSFMQAPLRRKEWYLQVFYDMKESAKLPEESRRISRLCFQTGASG